MPYSRRSPTFQVYAHFAKSRWRSKSGWRFSRGWSLWVLLSAGRACDRRKTQPGGGRALAAALDDIIICRFGMTGCHGQVRRAIEWCAYGVAVTKLTTRRVAKPVPISVELPSWPTSPRWRSFPFPPFRPGLVRFLLCAYTPVPPTWAPPPLAQNIEIIEQGSAYASHRGPRTEMGQGGHTKVIHGSMAGGEELSPVLG